MPSSTTAVARIFDGEREAKLIALACSKPPKGRARWTLRLLENKPASPVACGSTRPRQPSSTSWLAYPVNHGCTGLQSLDDQAVTPAFTGFRDICLQQYPRL